MSTLFLFGVVLSLAIAVKGNVPPQELIETLELSDDNIVDCYDGLDIKRDGHINMDDLDILFYHKEGAFAKSKFVAMIDIEADGSVEEDELKQFLKLRPVTNAIFECSYVNSKSLRQYCFADQIMTFVYLVIDQDTIDALFRDIEDAHDDKNDICAKEVADLAQYNDEFTAVEQENFLLEIGGDDQLITLNEFTAYVIQEDLQDDFRQCRLKLEGMRATYNTTCMIIQLLDYTMNHLTEMDIALSFDLFDKDGNKMIEEKDLIGGGMCNEEVAKRFIALMDESEEGDDDLNKVTYGEFRNYIRNHYVKMHLERDCSRPKKNQADELSCYKDKIIALVTENHTPIWLSLPDLDMLFLFEELDHTDDGQIKIMEDLLARKWDKAVAEKLIKEMDGHDEDKDVNLEEFYEYVGIPNIVFALADCVTYKRLERVACYEKELQDVIKHILEKEKVEKFFEWYDKDGNKKITAEDLDQHKVKGEPNNNFLLELGMGDKEVNFNEFSWFVRQQELSHLITDCDKTPETLHPILLKYLDEIMTEYDIQQLFWKLDTNHNWELETADFGAEDDAVTHLLRRMDTDDPDNTVNFYEFWLYLNTPIDSPRKRHLEDSCTKPEKTQEAEMNCYAREIVNVGKEEKPVDGSQGDKVNKETSR